MEQEYDITDDVLFDSFLTDVGEWLNTPKVKMLNVPRLLVFRKVLNKLLGSIERDWLVSEVDVSDDPLDSGDVSVSFIMRDFVVLDTKAFAESISAFSNFEIYPTEDGNMRFAAIFPAIMMVDPLA